MRNQCRQRMQQPSKSAKLKRPGLYKTQETAAVSKRVQMCYIIIGCCMPLAVRRDIASGLLAGFAQGSLRHEVAKHSGNRYAVLQDGCM